MESERGSDWTLASSHTPLEPSLSSGSHVCVSRVSGSTCGSVQFEQQTALIDLTQVFDGWPSPTEFDPREARLCVLTRRKHEDI